MQTTKLAKFLCTKISPGAVSVIWSAGTLLSAQHIHEIQDSVIWIKSQSIVDKYHFYFLPKHYLIAIIYLMNSFFNSFIKCNIFKLNFNIIRNKITF